MLKKRLLSSVMASIMAVSAFSVVTSADDAAVTTTAEETATTAVKTKAELKAYVDTFTAEYINDVYKFGTAAAERWNRALAVAENVLADSASTEQDTTNAYYMLETATAANIQRTKNDLQALITKYKKMYMEQNILNEEMGDVKYDPDAYFKFEDAYIDAESVLDSGDAELITNAYDALESAANISELTSVSKSEFRTIIKKLESALNNEFNYETWRRGSISAGDTLSDGTTKLTWGDVVGSAPYTMANSTTYLGAKDTAAIYTNYDLLNGYTTVNKTTDQAIIDSYKDAVKIVDAITSFKVDAYSRSSKAAVEKEITSNFGDIAFKFANTVWVSQTSGFEVDDSAATYDVATPTTKLVFKEDVYTATNTSGNQTNDTKKAAGTDYTPGTYYTAGSDSAANEADITKKVIDQTGLYTEDSGSYTTVANGADFDDGATYYTLASAATTKAFFKDTALTATGKEYLTHISGTKYRVRKDFPGYSKSDIIDILEGVTLANLVSAMSDTDIAAAFGRADDAIKNGLSTTNVNSDIATTDSAKWAVIYREVKYILNDNSIPLTDTTKSISELQKLVNESYDLVETDSATFKQEIADVVSARKDAIQVIREKDTAGVDAAYTALNDDMTTFKNKMANYKYSYGDIATGLFAAYKNIDGDEFITDDAYKAAADAVAKALISLESSAVGDEAFDYDYSFIEYNRLYTDKDSLYDGTSSERALRDAYAKLADLTAKLEEKPEFAAGDVNGDGKVDTADALLILDYFTLDGKLAEGTVFHVEAADVNGDKVVGDSADALAALDIFTKA